MIARTLCGTLLVALSLSFAACHHRPAAEESAETVAVPSGLTAGEHVFTAADGSQIPYDVAGAGDATVVLIHCWMCERTYWSEQVPVLAERYRTIALDLPGHGEASRDRAAWSIAGYGEDVAALLRELDLHDVVLVGHSMGGPVSLKAAALSPGRVRGIVAVDTLQDAEADVGAQLAQFLPPFEADFSGNCRSFLTQMFPEEGVEEIVARVSEKGCDEARRDVGIALMKDFAAVDETWYSAAGVPIRAINSAANPTNVEGNRKYADFDLVVMEGVGHFPHMTRPEQFNPLLLDAVAQLLVPRAAPSSG